VCLRRGKHRHIPHFVCLYHAGAATVLYTPKNVYTYARTGAIFSCAACAARDVQKSGEESGYQILLSAGPFPSKRFGRPPPTRDEIILHTCWPTKDFGSLEFLDATAETAESKQPQQMKSKLVALRLVVNSHSHETMTTKHKQ